MAHFPDLSPYCYDGGEPRLELLNVGWLSKDQPFTRGPVPAALLAVLRQLHTTPKNLYRGTHICELCQPPQDILRLDQDYFWIWASAREGNGEIHLPGLGRITYTAPRLVLHYILEHQYRPPQEFIDAALQFHELQLHSRSAEHVSGGNGG